MSDPRVKAFDELAKEFRRASWGAAVAFAGFSYKLGSGLAIAFAAGSWLVLQVVAFGIQLNAIAQEKGDQR